jgi:undecaprenyl-diphosphatase
MRTVRTTAAAVLLFLAAGTAGNGQEFIAPWKTDGICVGVGLSAFACGEFLVSPGTTPEKPAADPIRFPDALGILPFNRTLDTLSDFTQYGSFVFPGLLLFIAPDEDPLVLLLMYTEAALFSIGVKDALKGMVPRYRPYTYAEAASGPDDSDSWHSFPSGHTVMAFLGASFLTGCLLIAAPDSPWTGPLIGASYTAAGTTGILRVLSGSHFITDVLAGALIGTAAGFAVPLLHRNDSSE